MATDLTNIISAQIARSLGIPDEQVYCTLDGDTMIVTITGEVAGRSVRNAVRRRQRAMRVARDKIKNLNLQLSVTFAIRDAVTAIEDLVRASATLVLDRAPETVQISVRRTGNALVVIAATEMIEEHRQKLTRLITPILQGAGLSLTDIRLVSPMSEDVSDARILRIAKILAPCSGIGIARYFKQLNESEINAEQMHRRLDVLRQKGFLVYLGNRTFALTLKGLASVPVSTRRDSSDVERVLAVARRKW